MTKQEKMIEIKKMLMEIENMIDDHLEHCDPSDLNIHSFELIKSAVEIYEDHFEKGESE